MGWVWIEDDTAQAVAALPGLVQSVLLSNSTVIDHTVHVEQHLVDVEDRLIDLEGAVVATKQEVQDKLDALGESVNTEVNQIAAAVAVVASELTKLTAAVENPDLSFDTTKVDAAVSQLTSSVDSLQALEPVTVEPTPEPTPEPPVEEPPADTPPPADGEPVPPVDTTPVDEAPAEENPVVDAPPVEFEPADGVGEPENPPADGTAVEAAPEEDNFRLQ